MAGSSLCYCWRRPWLEHSLGVSLSEAVVVGCGIVAASELAGRPCTETGKGGRVCSSSCARINLAGISGYR